MLDHVLRPEILSAKADNASATVGEKVSAANRISMPLALWLKLSYAGGPDDGVACEPTIFMPSALMPSAEWRTAGRMWSAFYAGEQMARQHDIAAGMQLDLGMLADRIEKELRPIADKIPERVLWFIGEVFLEEVRHLRTIVDAAIKQAKLDENNGPRRA